MVKNLHTSQPWQKQQTSFSLRLDVRGEWLIIPANPDERWDLHNRGKGLAIDSDSASDSECDYKPKTRTIIKPDSNLLYIHSGRVAKQFHPKEIWGEVSIHIGLVTKSAVADIIFIPPSMDLGADTCIALAWPQRDDAIRFEEKRLYGFGEHLHGPFTKQRAYGIRVRLSDSGPLPKQTRNRETIDASRISTEFY